MSSVVGSFDSISLDDPAPGNAALMTKGLKISPTVLFAATIDCQCDAVKLTMDKLL